MSSVYKIQKLRTILSEQGIELTPQEAAVVFKMASELLRKLKGSSQYEITKISKKFLEQFPGEIEVVDLVKFAKECA